MAGCAQRSPWKIARMNDRRCEIESKFKFVLTHATFVRGKMPDRKNFRTLYLDFFTMSASDRFSAFFPAPRHPRALGGSRSWRDFPRSCYRKFRQACGVRSRPTDADYRSLR